MHKNYIRFIALNVSNYSDLLFICLAQADITILRLCCVGIIEDSFIPDITCSIERRFMVTFRFVASCSILNTIVIFSHMWGLSSLSVLYTYNVYNTFMNYLLAIFRSSQPTIPAFRGLEVLWTLFVVFIWHVFGFYWINGIYLALPVAYIWHNLWRKMFLYAIGHTGNRGRETGLVNPWFYRGLVLSHPLVKNVFLPPQVFSITCRYGYGPIID